uniref:Centromere protein X n=1 Tax=Lactuca sativa TaxID=4236 RepID=A0A9R1VM68_LACSA|nr:hypothetical protein LSAT_V11C500233990 [Lactuca sativa]
MENNFDQDLIYAIFKMVWSKKAIEREKNVDGETSKGEEGAGSSKKNRPTSGNDPFQVPLASQVNDMTFPMRLSLHFSLYLLLDFCKSSLQSTLGAANSNAVKLSCEKLRLFVSEAVHRAATIAEAEGRNKIEATHLERILPQLLLDF